MSVQRGFHRSSLPILVLAAAFSTAAVSVVRAETGAAETRADMNADAPIIIAHRGASAYLPEHTLPAKALAHAMGSDYIEQDVVLSADGVPVVLHDIHLDATTNVAELYPSRARSDGRFYAIDFTLEELHRLRVHERRRADGSAVYPQRFPAQAGLSQLPTLAEEIALIAGLNRSRGARAGLYIEMKGTAFHRREGQDLPAAVLRVLEDSAWQGPVYLQSFEPDALRYLRDDLGTELPLIQLIGENSWMEDGAVDFDFLRSDAGLDDIASYADGIGPWLMQLYRGRDEAGGLQLTDLAERAHVRGLVVHPYTFRADELPPGIDSFEELHDVFLRQLGVDGLFTDFPDRSRSLRDRFVGAGGPGG
jgi:glycerophosphoryl diester phosphodiesterase